MQEELHRALSRAHDLVRSCVDRDLRQQEDSELDFIHTLFKKMSHPTTVSFALLYSYTFHILGHSM